MRNNNHTPGPWHINTIEANPHTVHSDRGLVATCMLPPPFGPETWSGHTVYETEANARLIAAAPELLAALEGLLSVVNVRIDDPRIELFDAARAALAKAKGGAE